MTTNGVVKQDGCLVMGAGCALEALNRFPARSGFPGVARLFGEAVSAEGNSVVVLRGELIGESWDLVSFPVKHHYRDRAELSLIERSARRLVELADQRPQWRTVAVPRPGCGLGGRDWKREVEPLLAGILDDRFLVVTSVPGRASLPRRASR